MISVSLEVLLSYAFAISALLMALNYRGKSAVASGAVLLGLLVVIGIEKVPSRDFPLPIYRGVQLWLVSELLPTAAVFWLSRAEFSKAHPWWLLVGGPLAFFIALVAFSAVYQAVRFR